MNFAIKLHSERAPRAIEELHDDLASNSTFYSFEEISSFLIQFYMVREHGVLSLDSDLTSASALSLALNNGSSIHPASSKDLSLEDYSTGNTRNDRIVTPFNSFDTAELIMSYLEEAYTIAAEAFGMAVKKDQNFQGFLRNTA